MASNGQLRCSLCQLTFPFKSKLDRHLVSDNHRMFAESLLVEEDNVDEALQIMERCPSDSGEDDLHSDHSSEDHSSEDSINDDNIDLESLFETLQSGTGNDYSPFPDKMTALLFFLQHGAKPMGETNLKFVWFCLSQLLSQCDIAIPSFSVVKKFKLPGLTPPVKFTTPSGMPYYVITITSIIKRCMANPVIANDIQRYPVVTSGTYREIFHASRWHNDPRYYSPMAYLNDGRHVFIQDCIQCHYPPLGIVAGIVKKFIVMECSNELNAEVNLLLTPDQFNHVVPNVLGSLQLHATFIIFETVQIPIFEIFEFCHRPISLIRFHSGSLYCLSEQECSDFLKPHSMKVKASGRPVVMLPLVLFSDDTSGNVSKKWNKFDSYSVMLAGLPRHKNSKLTNIHFCCCSNKVSAVDMSEAIVSELELLQEGIEAYDAVTEEIVVVVAPLLCIIADNPRASELLNHLGPSAKNIVTNKDVNPDQLDIPRSLALSLQQMDTIRQASTETTKLKLRTEFGVKEVRNPMLNLSVDLFVSTPVETLHSILLGPYKYLLKRTVPGLSAVQKEQVLARIRAFSYSGFRVRLYGNVIRYHQSFVGRDYKAWAQMCLFIIYPYLSSDDQEVWLSLSKVFQLAYCNFYNPAKNGESKKICEEFIDAVRRHKPEMLKKQKVHLILHLVDCMQQFGPTSAFNSERFEMFNSYIRAHNIHGNKSAPSKDIANRFAVLQQLRCICEGGNFNESSHGCGEDLKALYSLSDVQHFLNSTPKKDTLAEKTIYQPGAARFMRKDAVTFSALELHLCDLGVVSIGSLRSPFIVHAGSIPSAESVTKFSGVIGQDGEMVHSKDFIELSSCHYEMKFGVFLACCRRADGYTACIIRGLYGLTTPLGDCLLNDLDCPLFELGNVIFTAPTSEVVRAVSMVHQCTATCTFSTIQVSQNMERESLSTSRLEYKHDFVGNMMYCLNTYASTTSFL